MVPISFTSDHIETLYEMDHTYKGVALESGFESYSRVKPPGEDPRLAACLKDILVSHGFGAH
jgi:ferrochelatase